MLSPTKASILCFPQRFDGSRIFLNILFVPREDPLEPFIKNLPAGTDAEIFAKAELKFAARLIPSLEFLPGRCSEIFNYIFACRCGEPVPRIEERL
jgi:hypothetical protein